MARTAWTKRGPARKRQPRSSFDATRKPVQSATWREQEPRPRPAWLGWPLWVLTRLVAPVLLLAGIACGVIYVRLLNGPISLKSLAEPIAKAIEADLGGFGVAVGDAAVVLTDDHTLEFRLRDVQLSDRDKAPVALAPLAAVTLSTNALWVGKIAPERVVLIEPRLLLFYSRENGLSLSFARPQSTAETSALQSPVTTATPAVAAAGAAYDAASDGRVIDMGKTIAGLATQAHDDATAASFLKQVGLRNATLIFDTAGQQAIWRIPDADFGFNHRRQGNVVGGNMMLATAAGRRLRF